MIATTEDISIDSQVGLKLGKSLFMAILEVNKKMRLWVFIGLGFHEMLKPIRKESIQLIWLHIYE